MSKLVSILLPIYNMHKYLPDCMETLLNQTYEDIEIVLVDDGSCEECAQLCDSYKEKDHRVVVYHKTNGGISDARNFGVAKAKGEYITFVDPDDYVDRDYLMYLMNLMEKYHTKMAICQHRVVFKNGKCEDFGKDIADEVITNEACIERLLYHNDIDTACWAKVYHRSLFQNIEYPVGKLFEDMGTTYKLMLLCDQIAVGHESKYSYRVHSNSIVPSDFKTTKFHLLEMTDNCAKDVTELYPSLAIAAERRQVYARLSTINQMAHTNKYPEKLNEMISFVKEHKNSVLKNSKAPKRDTVAVLLLMINYSLYKNCWAFSLRRKKGI